jgi:phospholipase C
MPIELGTSGNMRLGRRRRSGSRRCREYRPLRGPILTATPFAIAGRTVSYLDPRFEDEGSGTSGDDHPHADIRVGQSFVNQVYEAITAGPAWGSTVFVITYDEWGGFFDHVLPTVAPDATPSNGLRGFRVPALVISPRARRNTVAHNVYDHTSALKMIEWRWNLPALTPRDGAAATWPRSSTSPSHPI